ncbi:MAG: hypothetical protein N3D80_12185 [Ignavibacterium album]|jgi:hypothetical protein|uniref:Outer membrane protein beta-barrel domain-containing protein n=1 Tax=Ignavibacterium album TaxID=591197 RepID=A0A7V3E843_9BACT|nr:hypothetical protein [Ignavibacterium album]MCX8106616.1 hypothetical protein [Ignavibacterium album]
MKKFLIIVSLFFTAFQLIAQNDSYSEEKNEIKRFYVSLTSKAAALNGSWGLFGGMKAGINISEQLSLGLAGYGMIPNRLGGSYINRSGRDTLHFGYGGVDAEFDLSLSDKTKLTGSILLGAGRVDYENLSGSDYFFIMEPLVSIKYMFTRWFGLAYSGGYRFAAGVKYADFSDASFSGWSTDLSIIFKF